MRQGILWLGAVFVLPIILACGTLEIGIEQTPSAVAVDTSAQTTITPSVSTLVDATTPTTATATATATLSVPPTRERITFAPGGTIYTVPVTLTRNVTKAYVLTIFAQQQLILSTDGDVTIVVLDSQSKPVIPVSARQGQWVGAIPQKGDYTILLSGDGRFTLTINIPPLGG